MIVSLTRAAPPAGIPSRGDRLPALTGLRFVAAVAVFVFAYRRNSESNLVRQVLWIFAASQLLALLLVLFAVVVKWLVIVGLVVFAVVGLAILLFDRR